MQTYSYIAIACAGRQEVTDEYLPEVYVDAETSQQHYTEHNHAVSGVIGEVLALDTVFHALNAARDIARQNAKRLVVRLSGHGGLSVFDGYGRTWFFYLGTPTKDRVLWWPMLVDFALRCAAEGIQLCFQIDACHARPQKRKAANSPIVRVKGIAVFDDQTDGQTFDLSDDQTLPRRCLLMGACKRRQQAYGAINSVFTVPRGNGVFDTRGGSLWSHLFDAHMRRGVVLPEPLRKEVNASTRHFILGTAPNVTNPNDVPDMSFRDNGWAGPVI